ncbi:hypothetical protein HDU76_001374 [Blyttiomyces sp. JEL0837]|nr:hypothetical protein HDU76_001374 [Blyttiomyces sp. JEL0837]
MSTSTHEFRLQATINELLTKLNIPTETANKFYSLLIKSSTSPSTSATTSPTQESILDPSATTNLVNVIADRVGNPQARSSLLEGYQKLKGQQVLELGAFVGFLERVMGDDEVMGMLKGDESNIGSLEGMERRSGVAGMVGRGDAVGVTARRKAGELGNVNVSSGASKLMSRPSASGINAPIAGTKSNVGIAGKGSSRPGIPKPSVSSGAAPTGPESANTNSGKIGVGLSSRGRSLLSVESGAGSSQSTPTRGLAKVRSLSTNNLADIAKGSGEKSFDMSINKGIPGTPSINMDGTTIIGTPTRGRSASLNRSMRRSSSRANMDEKPPAKVLPAPFSSKYSYDLTSKLDPFESPQSLGKLSLFEQEGVILEDLLFVLQGMTGVYIKRHNRKSGDRVKGLEESAHEVPVFTVDGTLDVSLSELVKRVLPLASNYALVNHFIETHSRFEYGKVSHALCAAMRIMVKDYLILVAQLEHQIHFAPGFGLHHLWTHVVPTLHVLDILAGLVKAVYVAEGVGRDESDVTRGRSVVHEFHSSVRGGGVLLSVISERLIGLKGDAVAKKIHTKLLEKASVPYISMLKSWIHNGEIVDPFDEFMIEERRGMNKDLIREDFNDVYWEKRYMFRVDAVPSFFRGIGGNGEFLLKKGVESGFGGGIGGGEGPDSPGLCDKILLAGKYLNVVRECGIEIPEVEERVGRVSQSCEKEKAGGLRVAAFGDSVKAVDGGRFVEEVEVAYRFANQTLLDLLFMNESLMGHLRSLKTFFLLAQSDYLTHFLDLAHSELLLPVGQVSIDSLRSILELVVRSPGSACRGDPNKENITIAFSSYGLMEQLMRVTSVSGEGGSAGGMVGGIRELHGIDAIMLDYTVGFPASLILNKRVITKYQLLFRHLLRCKHVERLLSFAWLDHVKRRGTDDERKLNRPLTKGKAVSGSFTEALMGKSGGWVGLKRKESGGGGIGGPQRVPVRKAGSGSLEDKDDADGAGVRESDEERNVRKVQEVRDRKFVMRMSLLRGRLLCFIQQHLHFLCFEVVEPNWANLETRLGEVTTVDEVLRHHNDFLDTCLKDCMLTNQKLLKLFNQVVNNCMSFVAFAEAQARKRGHAAGLYSYNPAADSFAVSTPAEPIIAGSTATGAMATGETATGGIADEMAAMDAAETRLKALEEEQVAVSRAFINALQFISGSVTAGPMFGSDTGVGGGLFGGEAAESWIGSSGGSGGFTGFGSTGARMQDLVTRLDYNLYYSQVPLSGLAGLDLSGLEVRG